MAEYKILLDTDIGDDIDDLLCLQLGLTLPEVRFVGITTVFMNTNLRARMVNKVLELNGVRDIPVYAGCGDGMARRNDITNIMCQYDESMAEDRYRPCNEQENCGGESAVNFILDCARRCGNELIILAIGPFTNVAKAIEKDPETMKNIGRIVVMGGGFFRHFIEWNVQCDPEAAKILNDFVIPVEYVGADVTHKCYFNEEECAYVTSFTEGYRGYLSEKLKVWREKHRATHRHPYLHDPLALMYIVDANILTMKDICVKVETQGTLTKGMTLNCDSCYSYSPVKPKGKRNLVAVDVRAEEFIRRYIEIVFQGGKLEKIKDKEKRVRGFSSGFVAKCSRWVK